MLKNLYPDVAGIRSKYFEFFTSNRSKMVGAAISVVLVSLIALLTSQILGESLTYVLMQFVFFIIGSLFMVETTRDKTKKRKKLDIVERIRTLLETAGYLTELNPRTEDASIDPLLTNLDILARREDHNLLLDIRSPVDADQVVDWKSASSLIQSKYLLSTEKEIQPKDLDARLLLIDIKPDPSLKRISEREKIPIQPLSSKDIDRVLEISNIEEKKQEIQSLLKLPVKGISGEHLSKN
jgi:hypothetical protein